MANATVVEWLYAKDAVPGLDPRTKVGVLAIHTCREIAPDEEIYFYYGDLYDRRHYGRRPYNVGKGCKNINQAHIPQHERPRNVMLRIGVKTVPEGAVYIEL